MMLFPLSVIRPRTFLLSLSLCLPLSLAQATPVLRCQVTYAGDTTIVEAHPTTDPYKVEGSDIRKRFRFKPVVVGTENNIDYIKIYTYFQAPRKDILLHQASYFPPFTLAATPINLTPHNRIYGSAAEREMQYECTLQGDAP